MIRLSYVDLERDRYGYAKGNNWHPIAAAHNDAIWAAYHAEPDINRLATTEKELRKLRRQIEDRMRKDCDFLYEVATLFQNLYFKEE